MSKSVNVASPTARPPAVQDPAPPWYAMRAAMPWTPTAPGSFTNGPAPVSCPWDGTAHNRAEEADAAEQSSPGDRQRQPPRRPRRGGGAGGARLCFGGPLPHRGGGGDGGGGRLPR